MNNSLTQGNPARTRDEDAIGTPPEIPTLVPA
jgi:choline monooxygenase